MSCLPYFCYFKLAISLIRSLLVILYCIAFISCDQNENRSSEVTWIGGEIVNPKLDYVIFSKDNKVLDTVYLGDDNFFLYKADSITDGLYSFRHYEYQIIYLEPGDSLMMRVNTVDFDESLAFSGKGAERNTLLMDFFLMNEEETKQLPMFYSLEPKEFQKKIDSFTKARTAMYNEFIVKNSLDKNFQEIAKANINYDGYIKKELYTSVNLGKNTVAGKDFPDDFYDYREEVDFGNTGLRSYFPYYRFLNLYFDNLAYEKYKDYSDFDRYSFVHNWNKVKIMDSIITSDSLKIRLVRGNVINYLLRGKDAERGPDMVELFSHINLYPACNIEMQELAESAMMLTPGKEIPNVLLLNADNIVKDLHSILRKNTVLFFWSSQSISHFRNIHAKAAELSAKYPEYDFIGINTDTHFKKWRNVVTQSGYDKTKEYQFDNIDHAEQKLVINSANKAIVINSKGIILNGNTSLFNMNIEASLLGYLNRAY